MSDNCSIKVSRRVPQTQKAPDDPSGGSILHFSSAWFRFKTQIVLLLSPVIVLHEASLGRWWSVSIFVLIAPWLWIDTFGSRDGPPTRRRELLFWVCAAVAIVMSLAEEAMWLHRYWKANE